MLARSRRWVVAVFASWRSSPIVMTLFLLPKVSRRLTAALGAVGLATALIPSAMMVATGFAVGAVPAAMGEGLDSPQGKRLLVGLVVLGALYFLSQAIQPSLDVASSMLGWRLAEYVQERIVEATLAPVGIAHLEDAAFRDQFAQAHKVGTGRVHPAPGGARLPLDPDRHGPARNRRSRDSGQLPLVGPVAALGRLSPPAPWVS